jgi:hypothetical protein
MIPFDGRRTFGALEYLASLTKDRRLLTKWVLKPNVGLCALALRGRLESSKASRLCPVVQTSTYGESIIDLNVKIEHRPIDLKAVLHAGSAVVGLRSAATAPLVTTGPRLVVDLAELTRCSLARIPMIPPQLETCRDGRKIPSDA